MQLTSVKAAWAIYIHTHTDLCPMKTVIFQLLLAVVSQYQCQQKLYNSVQDTSKSPQSM